MSITRTRSPVLLLAISAFMFPVLIGAMPTMGQSGSLGVTPAEVQVTQAQPEETYERSVTVQNQMDTLTRFSLELRDGMADWTTISPSERLEVPARSSAGITLTFEVPADAYVGTHTGHLSIVADPMDQPAGSGLATKWGVTVLLNVTVGGEPFEDIQWGDPVVPDVEVGTPPTAAIPVTNAGNVLTTARAGAQVLAFDTDDELASAESEISVIPGQQEDLEFAFDETLPEGQYRMRITSLSPPGFETTVPFKVVPPGALGKEGMIRFLEHEPWVRAGDPVRITAVFVNTGTVAIARSLFSAEIYDGDELRGAISSEPRVVQAGQEVELSTIYTPERPGELQIVGRVNYDGFETLQSESTLNVERAQGVVESNLWILVVLLGSCALVTAFVYIKRRRERHRRARP